MLGALTAVWAVLILPIVIRINIGAGEDYLLAGSISAKTLGINIWVKWKTVQTKNGMKVAFYINEVCEKRMIGFTAMNQKGMMRYQLIRNDALLKNNLISYAKLIRIKGCVTVGTGDAASTAIVCGLLNAVGKGNSRINIDVQPVFQEQRFNLDIRCIGAFCLGKLLVSAMLCLRSAAVQSIRRIAGGSFHEQSSDQQRNANGT